MHMIEMPPMQSLCCSMSSRGSPVFSRLSQALRVMSSHDLWPFNAAGNWDSAACDGLLPEHGSAAWHGAGWMLAVCKFDLQMAARLTPNGWCQPQMNVEPQELQTDRSDLYIWQGHFWQIRSSWQQVLKDARQSFFFVCVCFFPESYWSWNCRELVQYAEIIFLWSPNLIQFVYVLFVLLLFLFCCFIF